MSDQHPGYASDTGAPPAADVRAFALAFPEPVRPVLSAALHATPAEALLVPTMAQPLADPSTSPVAALVMQQLAGHGFHHDHGAELPALLPATGLPLPGDAMLAPEPGLWVAVKNLALLAVVAMAVLVATAASSNMMLIGSFAAMAVLLMVTFAVADRWRFEAAAHTAGSTVLSADGTVLAVVPPGGTWPAASSAGAPARTYQIDVT